MEHGRFDLLYVDDEVKGLNVFKESFKDEYNIYTALTRDEALRITTERHIDLLIANQRIPQMSGLDVLRKVIPQNPKMLRMIMTGLTDIGELISAVNEVGIHKYIVKPWNRSELKSMIDDELQKYARYNLDDTKNESDLSLNAMSSFIGDELLKDKNRLSKYFKEHFVISRTHRDITGEMFWVGQQGNSKILTLVSLPDIGQVSGPYIAGYYGIIPKMVYSADLRDDSELCQKTFSAIANSKLSSQIGEKFGREVKVSVIVLDEKDGKLKYMSNGNQLLAASQEDYVFVNDGYHEDIISNIDRLLLFTSGVNAIELNGISFTNLMAESSDSTLFKQELFLDYSLDIWGKENTLTKSMMILGIKP